MVKWIEWHTVGELSDRSMAYHKTIFPLLINWRYSRLGINYWYEIKRKKVGNVDKNKSVGRPGPCFEIKIISDRVKIFIDITRRSWDGFKFVRHPYVIAMTSKWALWRFKSPASQLFTQLFIQALIKQSIKSSTSLVIVRGIHRWTGISQHKGPATRNMLPFDDVIMIDAAPRYVPWNSTPHKLFFRGKKAYINIWCRSSWYDTGSWNLSSCTTRTHLFYIVSIMGADVPVRRNAAYKSFAMITFSPNGTQKNTDDVLLTFPIL